MCLKVSNTTHKTHYNLSFIALDLLVLSRTELIGISEKRMFGGNAFLVGGNLAVSASGQGGLLLRCDPDETATLLQEPHVRRFEMRGREMNCWLHIAPEAVEDDDAVKRRLLLHVELVQDELGTHRSEEPVSKSMRNVWAGVPMPMLPAHSSSSSSSVSDTEPVLRFSTVTVSRNGLISKSLGSAPVFCCRLRRERWYLLKARITSALVATGTAPKNGLVGLDVVQDSLLMVEGAVGLGEGATLSKRNTDTALLLDDGCCSRNKGEGYSHQCSFAEHGNEC